MNVHSLAPLPLCYLEQKSQRPVINGESNSLGFVPKFYCRNSILFRNLSGLLQVHVQS